MMDIFRLPSVLKVALIQSKMKLKSVCCPNQLLLASSSLFFLSSLTSALFLEIRQENDNKLNEENFPSHYLRLDDVPCATPYVKKSRVINGIDAEPEEFPWTALILKKGKQHCGGSLIDDRHVLTAAHCVAIMDPKEIDDIQVVLGEHDMVDPKNQNRVNRSLEAMFIHDEYYPTYKKWAAPPEHPHPVANDVAVLRMNDTVSFSSAIKPICLYKHNINSSNTELSKMVQVVGWGSMTRPATDSKGSKVSSQKPSILNTASLPLWDLKRCQEAFRNQTYSNIAPIPSMLCAGGGNKDSCKGDSGGPITTLSKDGKEVHQIGIVSWGISCASKLPGVYTDVGYFIKWIEQVRLSPLKTA